MSSIPPCPPFVPCAGAAWMVRAATMLALFACSGCVALVQHPSASHDHRASTPSHSHVDIADLDTFDDDTSSTSIVQTAATVDVHASEPPLSDPEASESPTAMQWRTEAIDEYHVDDPPFTLSQVAANARTHHPLVHAASREIEIAKAAVTTAGTPSNPNLVMDFDTPVHDRSDASELTTRITVPFGKSHELVWRRRLAMAQLMKAEANFQATLRQVSDTATAAALRSIYLQQRLVLDIRAEELAVERRDVLSAALPSDNPARNLLEQVEARVDADEATQLRFATQRDLAVTDAMLANRMGLHPPIVVSVTGTLDQVALTLPSLDEVIHSTEQESEQIIAALAALNESRAFHGLQRNISTKKQVGPRYQDRLGRDDDTLGLRLDVDLDFHHVQRGPISQSSKATQQQEDRVALARHEWLGEVTSVYLELESLTSELAHYRDDGFIEDQRAILEDEAAVNLLTADQRIEIEQSIVRRQREQLEREYRIAVLRSQLRLEPGIE